LNTKNLDEARERIPNVPLLINVVSRRVRQLNQGHRPMIKPDSAQMPAMDIALKEVAEGKLTAEMAMTESEESLESVEKVISL
jgi:DNA-directed RNA polymerase subunit omega